MSDGLQARLPDGARGAEWGVDAAYFEDPGRCLRELWTILGSRRGTRWSQRRFFADLDRHADGKFRPHYLAQRDPRMLARMAIHEPAVRTALLDRIHRRPRSGRAPWAGIEAVREDVEYLAALTLRLAREHFPGEHGLDLEQFGEAFECFASGQLRLLLPCGAWTTQPSSGYFFLFGEFALLAAECGIERETWTRLAAPMITTQVVFCRVYGPPELPASGATFSHYRPEYFDPSRRSARGHEPSSPAHGNVSLEELTELHARHLEAFVPGSLARP